jgi:DNA-binding transcriptional MerR regulator
MDRHLSPAETAKRFGTSIKALRLYEQRGLLTPLRTANGSTRSAWRVYGPDQIVRLHQILALKRLGLPLARIGEILTGGGNLDAVLALQEQALAQDSERLAQALRLVRAARAKLATGAALSIDDLTDLTKETAMTRLSPKEMNKIMTPFADQHFSVAEKDAIKAALGDRDQFMRVLDSLMAEAQALMQAGDPASPASQDFARRFSAHIGHFSKTMDSTMRAKSHAVWADAMNDPATAAKMALNREIFSFVDQAIAHRKAQAK